VLGSPADLFVVDPEGRGVGFDFVSQQVVNEIPSAVYSGQGTDPQVIWIQNNLLGEYDVYVIGTETGPYDLTIDFSEHGASVDTQEITGETVEGAVYVYRLNIAEEEVTINPDPAAELGRLEELIGGLPDDSFDKRKLASQRKNALFNKIDDVIWKVEAGNYTDAINKLFHDIRAKMDGDSTAEDWITDPETQSSLCVIIDHIISSIETLQQE